MSHKEAQKAQENCSQRMNGHEYIASASEAGRLFPLTPSLSLREREGRTPLSAIKDAPALRTLADFLPLLGERAGVRGTGATLHQFTLAFTQTPLRSFAPFCG